MSRRRSLAAWTRLGRELMQVDARRFGELFDLAARIVAIHRDPVGAGQDTEMVTPAWGKQTRGAS